MLKPLIRRVRNYARSVRGRQHEAALDGKRAEEGPVKI